MSNLNSQLNNIASEFVSAIIEALKKGSIDDLVNHVSSGASRASAVASVPGRRGPGRRRKTEVKAQPVLGTPSRTTAKGTRRKRASADDVERLKDLALQAARSLKSGFSKGDVMKKSGSKIDLGRSLALLVTDGKLTKKGDRRNTVYSVK